MHIVRAGTLGVLLAAAAPLAGCSDGPAPLGDPPSGSCEGYPGVPGEISSFGDYVLDNQSSSTVTIQSVTLGPTSKGLTIAGGAWILPILGGNMIAVGSWPPDRPPEQAPMAPAWAMRQHADGAHIKPGQTRSLILGVTRTTHKEPGRSRGPLIVYTAGGSTYTVQESPAIYLGQGGCMPGKSYS
jgi:hypothetical protein